MEVSVEQALAWRRDRHFLEAGARSVREVVGRLVAVPSWTGDADLAVRARLDRPHAGALADALATGDLIRTYAFRGSMQLLTAQDAGVCLAIRCAGRQWELRSWQEFYALVPQDWPALREVVREVVASGPVRHGELVDAVARIPRFRHLRDALASPSHTLLKPLAWQGDLCLGTPEQGQATFASPSASPRWVGLPDLDDAGPRAVLAYLAGYGPATRDNIQYWLAAGLSAGKRRVERWTAELVAAGRVVEVRVDVVPALHRDDQIDALAATRPDPDSVDLLPGLDQWVLGPGTADSRVVPPAHRQVVTRGANLLLRSGRVSGTWRWDRERLTVEQYPGSSQSPAALEAQVDRLTALASVDGAADAPVER